MRFRLRGKVVDSGTGRIIDRFRLSEGTIFNGNVAADGDNAQPNWFRPSTSVVDGHFDVRFPLLIFGPPETYYLVLRIEADGFAPAVSRRFQVDEGEVTLDIGLKKRP